MMVLTMVVGTAMDMTPTILILTPVLMPLVKAAGIDPVYFGVLFIINNAIGLITPPVGTVLSTVAGVGKISMDEVTQGRVALHGGAVRRDVPDGVLPAAGHGAGAAGSIDWFASSKLSQGDKHETLFLKTLVAAVAVAAFGLAPLAQAQTAPSSSPTRTPRAIPSCWAWRSSPRSSTPSRAASSRSTCSRAARWAATRPTVSSLQGGTLEMASMNSGIFASQVKDFAVYDFPFLFANPKEADAVVDGPFGKQLHAKLEEKGLVGLAYYELGFRS
jgi:hypothetical protein